MGPATDFEPSFVIATVLGVDLSCFPWRAHRDMDLARDVALALQPAAQYIVESDPAVEGSPRIASVPERVAATQSSQETRQNAV